MLVDDDCDSLAQLSDLLQSLGHSSDQFVISYEALASYKVTNYDAVITDLVMPYMDGIEMLKKIRKQRPKAKVVVITALTISTIMAEIINYGAYAILPKPINLERFIETIEAISLHSQEYESIG
jgi:DNA-binding NtrC family response regulator